MFEARQISKVIGAFAIRDIVIAHELFHYIESGRKDLYISRELIKVPGIFKNRSAKVRSLEEVAAMQFARDLLGLSINPFLLDILLIYEQNEDMAFRLYHYILETEEKESAQMLP